MPDTHESCARRNMTINPAQWQTKKGIQQLLSRFYNQSFLVIENKQLKNNRPFNFNPFETSHPDLIGLTYHFKNSFYFNRAKNKFTTAYHFIEGKQKSLYLFENLSNNSSSHQLQFIHQLNDQQLLQIILN